MQPMPARARAVVPEPVSASAVLCAVNEMGAVAVTPSLRSSFAAMTHLLLAAASQTPSGPVAPVCSTSWTLPLPSAPAGWSNFAAVVLQVSGLRPPASAHWMTVTFESGV
jgi:hypothetical protein